MPAKLTRQHFQFFADCIKDAMTETPNDLFSAQDRIVLMRLAERTAKAMVATNPAFDRERFLTACGVAS